MAPKRKRTIGTAKPETNPQVNPEIIDAPDALRASPDSDVDMRLAPGPVKEEGRSESPLSDVPDLAVEPPKKKRTASKPGVKNSTATPNGKASTAKPKLTPNATTPTKVSVKAEPDDLRDPEAEGDEEANDEDIKDASCRPPPVHSDYLPLPWKGRLGYVRKPSGVMLNAKANRRFRPV